MKPQNIIQSIDSSSASSKHSRVTLTKFNGLSVGQHKADQNSTYSIPSELSAADLVSAADSISSSSSTPRIGLNQNQRQWEASTEQFQIVWRQLSFEVDTRITSTFNRLSSILSPRTLPQAKAEDQLADRPVEQQQTRKKNKIIFENLNGYVKSGEITAILGPSGAGKTSLLNALCGRTDNYRGTIQLLGGPAGEKMRSSIIPQKDYLIEKLTVRECLYYASKILNSDKSFDHEANIHRVVKMLNLSACFDSSISRISGGEYKRVSIAQELLSQPDILILDEPTSGLDSLNCKNLIRALSSLMKASLQGSLNPMAIVMTIHQPDIEVFNMFDHVYCMARGGKVIYDGHPKDTIRVIKSHATPGESKTTSDLQFSQTRQVTEGPDNSLQWAVNPANLLIEIASGEYGARPIESLARLQAQQFETYATRPHPRQTDELSLDLKSDKGGSCGSVLSLAHDDANSSSISLDRSSNCSKPEPVAKLTRDKRLSSTRSAMKNSFFYLTNLLARRAFLATLRDPMISLVSLAFYLTIPLGLYVAFPQNIGSALACPMVVRDMEALALASNQTIGIAADLQEQLAVAHECGIMFFVVIVAFSMCNVAIAALSFPMNMHVLLKEARNGWYDLGSFVTAESIASLPFQVLFPAASVALVYSILGMPSSHLEWRMWTIALVVILQSMISQAYGLIFGALCMDSIQSAIFLSVASNLPQLLVSGFAVRIKQMPHWLGSLSHLSPYRYALQMTYMLRFGFGLCPCDESTSEYMRENRPRFTDVPARIKPLINYYLSQTNASDNTDDDRELAHIPGVYLDMKLNYSQRANIYEKLESNEIDVFKKMAEQLSRSFSFGKSIESCDSARSQLLNHFDTPYDHQLPTMFVCLLGLLIGFRILLFLAIRFTIRRRI